MRVYARFYDSGKYVCGSCSVFILDGRNNIETMINDARDYLRKLKTWKSFYNGFSIIKANSFNGPFKILYSEGLTKESALAQEME